MKLIISEDRIAATALDSYQAPPGVTVIGAPADFNLERMGDYRLVGGDLVLEPALPPLTRRQLRLALLSIGVTAEDVETHIAAITDPVERAAALIEWEDATHYKRDHPLVADVAAAMELPPEQVDDLWRWSAAL